MSGRDEKFHVALGAGTRRYSLPRTRPTPPPPLPLLTLSVFAAPDDSGGNSAPLRLDRPRHRPGHRPGHRPNQARPGLAETRRDHPISGGQQPAAYIIGNSTAELRLHPSRWQLFPLGANLRASGVRPPDHNQTGRAARGGAGRRGAGPRASTANKNALGAELPRCSAVLHLWRVSE